MDISINGNNYKTGRLDAFKQFHIARRLAPVLFSFGQAALKLKESAGEDDAAPADVQDAVAMAREIKETIKTAILGGIGPVVEALAKMSDEDSEYVLNACLDVTARQSGTGWAPMRVAGRLMFQDIDISDLLRIAGAVIRENLGNFLPGQQGETPPASTVVPISR